MSSKEYCKRLVSLFKKYGLSIFFLKDKYFDEYMEQENNLESKGE